MNDGNDGMDWLRRLRHDLIKPATWVARDFGESTQPTPTDRALLVRGLATLTDEEGNPCSPEVAWRAFRQEAPPEASPDALDAFEAAWLQTCNAAADAQLPVTRLTAALLAMEPAFKQLVRGLNKARDKLP